MQKIVVDRIRPSGAADPHGVAEARNTLRTAYAMIDGQLAGRDWAVGDSFTLRTAPPRPACSLPLLSSLSQPDMPIWRPISNDYWRGPASAGPSAKPDLL